MDGALAASRQAVTDFVRTTCGGTGITSGNAKGRQGVSSFPNTLLVVGIGDSIDEILASLLRIGSN